MVGAVVRCEHNFCLNRGHMLGTTQPKQCDCNQQPPNKKYGWALHQASGLANPHCLPVHKTTLNCSHSNSELSCCCGRTKATPKYPTKSHHSCGFLLRRQSAKIKGLNCHIVWMDQEFVPSAKWVIERLQSCHDPDIGQRILNIYLWGSRQAHFLSPPPQHVTISHSVVTLYFDAEFMVVQRQHLIGIA